MTDAHLRNAIALCKRNRLEPFFPGRPAVNGDMASYYVEQEFLEMLDLYTPEYGNLLAEAARRGLDATKT